jgi:hypothetical protein
VADIFDFHRLPLDVRNTHRRHWSLAKSIRDLNLKLEDLATTTPEIAAGTFTSRFFSSLFTRITAWFANAANGIGDFFPRRGFFEEVCVKDANGQICHTRSQVDAMLAGSAAAGAMGGGAGDGRRDGRTCVH